MNDFSKIPLAKPIAEALEATGYTKPTPIQVQAIPQVLEGRDLLGIAQTGTGKTAAFALPILDRLSRKPGRPPHMSTRVLILAPTRELAGQIAVNFKKYGQFLKLTVGTVFGGVPINRHIRQMQKGTDVLVATPGRLIDLIDRKAMNLDHVEVLVLDEADQMLDLGFIHALRRIVPLLPRRRQTLFFSATMPKSIADLAGQYLKDPAKVSVAPAATTAERVTQQAFYVNPGDKHALLVKTLGDLDYDRVLVFTRTKHGADKVVRKLEQAGISSAAIHGNKSQPQRERALAAFRSGYCKVLVATDIAARGVDVPGVSHVINYEIPNVPEQYVHRIGRTARAGADGLAISFVANDERPYMRDIEKLTRQKVEVLDLPDGFSIPEIPQSSSPANAAKPRGAKPGNRRRRSRSAGRQGANKNRNGQSGNRKARGAS
ncbi:DEAD/DEAH box helicase [Amaricoccus tamworthensis]|uniref:DEAD/DEAH box helicase n=1 Tax=Amaricoccus tamworthensis TaxID=57002 RepID=UPI003C7BF9AE